MRLSYSQARQRPVLLLPETVVVLNTTGAEILSRCDGEHTVRDIVSELGAVYRSVPADEVLGFLGGLVKRRCVELADE